MRPNSPKPLRTAQELWAELDWAAQVLTGDSSPSRILFALPTLATGESEHSQFNWDVQVSCWPDQDEAAQAAVRHVAGKWNLAAPDGADARMFRNLASAYREGANAAKQNPEACNPFPAEQAREHRAWALGFVAGVA